MGAAPSQENTVLFSYFRGTYETGLIPITRHFFGSDTGAAREPGDLSAMPTGAPASLSSGSFSRAELRAQLIRARDDPAMRYAVARDPASIGAAMARQRGVQTPSVTPADVGWDAAYWATMPDSNFTEKDLDHYLDVVDRYLYASDSAMVNDPRYAGHGPTITGATTSTSSMPPLFVPIPCALCLTYQEGKTRPDSFALNGRQAKIIGFFGLFPKDLQEAFKVVKYAGSDCPKRAARTCPLPHTAWPHGNAELTLQYGILSSAGDRTLERVVILASVAMRHYFHGANWRDRIEHCSSSSSAARAESRPAPAVLAGSPPPVAAYLSHALPPCPRGCFTLNIVKDQARAEPLSLDVHALAAALQRPAPVSAVGPDGSAQRENTLELVEETFDWALYRRLAVVPLAWDTAGNNYTALKSLVENCAFLHTQIALDTAESTLQLIDLPHPGKVATNPSQPVESVFWSPRQEEAEGGDDEHEKRGADVAALRRLWAKASPLKPTTAVSLHVSPSYLAQSAMWASCLFHQPNLICDQRWMQYKLKEECDALRHVIQKKDMLIAAWRRKDPVGASHYLGPNTPDLLRYIHFLQCETDTARNQPLESWQGPIFASDGRRYALHHSPIGAMLVGVRGAQPTPPQAPTPTKSAADTVRGEAPAPPPRRTEDRSPMPPSPCIATAATPAALRATRDAAAAQALHAYGLDQQMYANAGAGHGAAARGYGAYRFAPTATDDSAHSSATSFTGQQLPFTPDGSQPYVPVQVQLAAPTGRQASQLMPISYMLPHEQSTAQMQRLPEGVFARCTSGAASLSQPPPTFATGMYYTSPQRQISSQDMTHSFTHSSASASASNVSAGGVFTATTSRPPAQYTTYQEALAQQQQQQPMIIYSPIQSSDESPRVSYVAHSMIPGDTNMRTFVMSPGQSTNVNEPNSQQQQQQQQQQMFPLFGTAPSGAGAMGPLQSRPQQWAEVGQQSLPCSTTYVLYDDRNVVNGMVRMDGSQDGSGCASPASAHCVGGSSDTLSQHSSSFHASSSSGVSPSWIVPGSAQGSSPSLRGFPPALVNDSVRPRETHNAVQQSTGERSPTAPQYYYYAQQQQQQQPLIVVLGSPPHSGEPYFAHR